MKLILCNAQHALCSVSSAHKQALNAFYLNGNDDHSHQTQVAILQKLKSIVRSEGLQALMFTFPDKFFLSEYRVNGEAIQKTNLSRKQIFPPTTNYILLSFLTSGNVILDLSSNILHFLSKQ